MAHGMSLHIGVGQVDPVHYLRWSGAAPACVSDSSRMRQLAAAKGFIPTLLQTPDTTTADRVLEEIGRASNALNSGDIFLITFAGHGATVPDINGDEGGGDDDVWVLYDRMLIDDELYNLWHRFNPGVRIIVITDSCTNGTVISVPSSLVHGLQLDHGNMLHIRAMPNGDGSGNSVYLAHKDCYDKIQMATKRIPPQCTIALLASSRDGEPSFDNGKYGFFTNSFIQHLSSGNFSGTYYELYDVLSQELRSYENPSFYIIGAPNPNFPNQKALTI